MNTYTRSPVMSTTFGQSNWISYFPPHGRNFNLAFYRMSKRIMDLVLVCLFSPAWLAVIGLIALLIKLDSPNDPVFFLQTRTGKGGRRFGMHKLRTMVVNAETLKMKYAHLNELQWPDFKITNDPRITRIGRFLRRTSLDELPQLINVLNGEMSLVGPRPTSFSAETYDLWHTQRLDVTPGLTGLWQVLGRGETEFNDRLRLDILYIERRSLALDLYILLETVLAVLKQRGK